MSLAISSKSQSDVFQGGKVIDQVTLSVRSRQVTLPITDLEGLGTVNARMRPRKSKNPASPFC